MKPSFKSRGFFGALPGAIAIAAVGALGGCGGGTGAAGSAAG